MSQESYRSAALKLTCILAITALAYFNSLSNTFAWDDIYLVVRNPYIKGWENIPQIFTTGYWASLGRTGGLYRPLTMLSFLTEYSLWGLNPFMYHLDNVLLHFLCSLLVYFILREIFTEGESPFFAALLFAVHPAHVESVAWVSGRAELLAGAFSLASFLAFIKPFRRMPWYAPPLFFFLLALLSKETAGILPALVFLYLLIVKKEKGLEILKALVPYVIVLALYMPLRMTILEGHIGPREHVFQNVEGYWVFLTMCKAFFYYMRLFFFPTGLTAFYLFPPPGSIFAPTVLATLGLAAALVLAAPRLKRRVPLVLFFMLWVFVTLLPVSNIVPTEVIMTERAMYLPSVGLCALMGVFFSKTASLTRVKPGLSGPLSTAFFGMALGFFCLLSADRSHVWRDERTFALEQVRMHTRIAEDFPDLVSNYIHLSDAYVQLGRYVEAEPVLRKALGLDPKSLKAMLGLAAVHRAQGKLQPALAELESALEVAGGSRDQVYTDIASILYETGQKDKAESYLLTALKENPKGALQNLNYGYVLLDRGDKEGALRYFNRAGELDPNLYPAFFEQGLLLGEDGDFAGAVRTFKKAAAIDPYNPEARFYLGAAYQALGRREEAGKELEEALRIRPDYPRARELYMKVR